jgi:L-threonylcarbamoyladenylate synthase
MQIVLEEKVNIQNLVILLKRGKVIAMPTETAYGLIALATHSQAIENIYRIKGRDFKKPLPVICSSLHMVKKFFYVPLVLEKLARKYWPGDLSIKLKIKNMPGRRTLKISHDGTGVVRVSSNKLLLNISRKLGRPITATSANISGQDELYSGQMVFNQFKNKKFVPDLIIAGKKLSPRRPSTIVSLEYGKLVILRQGEIKIKL